MEKARDGNSSVADLMSEARTMLGANQVLPSVPALLDEVQVEATFPDGTKVRLTAEIRGSYALTRTPAP